MSSTIAKRVTYKYTSMSRSDIAAVFRMLNAAGEVLVVRAMAKTCKVNYKNEGWDNCWFTQMFGGKANLRRMTEAFVTRTFGNTSGFNLDVYHEGAIAEKLGIAEADVTTVIGIFDNQSKNPENTEYDSWSGYESSEYDTSVVEVGKVVAFLETVTRWLARRGIVLTPVFDAHLKPINDQ